MKTWQGGQQISIQHLMMDKIKGIEADYTAGQEGGSKSSARWTGQAQDTQIPKIHKICGKVHPQGKCAYKCRHCQKRGHKSEDCYRIYSQDTDSERNPGKQDISGSKKQRKTKIKLDKEKKKAKARQTLHDLESANEADSVTERVLDSAPETENEEEPRQSVRQTKRVEHARRIKQRKGPSSTMYGKIEMT
jgi:hypothetical protein